MTPAAAPMIDGYRLGPTDVAAWCPTCRVWHTHGIAGAAAHRVRAMCGGWSILVVGPATDAVLADMRSKRPKGIAQ